MNDEVAVENEKSKGSLVKVVAVAVLSLVVGYGAGAFTGQPLVVALGMSEEANVQQDEAVADAAPVNEEPPLFEPMEGVFDPDKKRFYAEVGEFCLLYTSPSPRDLSTSRMPSSA